MDFGDIIILLILFAPLLRRLFGKKQRPTPPPTGKGIGQQPSLAPPDGDPLAEALRQIREALAEQEPASVAPPKASPPKPAPAKLEPEFHALGSFEHDEHGFGASNPISEELFERRDRVEQKAASTARIKQKALDKVDLNRPIEVTRHRSQSAASIARMLTDETRLREAFVMKEILDPPRSLSRER